MGFHAYPGIYGNHRDHFAAARLGIHFAMGLDFGLGKVKKSGVPEDTPTVTKNKAAKKEYEKEIDLYNLRTTIKAIDPALFLNLVKPELVMPRVKVTAYDDFQDGVKKTADNFTKEQAAPRKNILQRFLSF